MPQRSPSPRYRDEDNEGSRRKRKTDYERREDAEQGHSSRYAVIAGGPADGAIAAHPDELARWANVVSNKSTTESIKDDRFYASNGRDGRGADSRRSEYRQHGEDRDGHRQRHIDSDNRRRRQNRSRSRSPDCRHHERHTDRDRDWDRSPKRDSTHAVEDDKRRRSRKISVGEDRDYHADVAKASLRVELIEKEVTDASSPRKRRRDRSSDASERRDERREASQAPRSVSSVRERKERTRVWDAQRHRYHIVERTTSVVAADLVDNERRAMATTDELEEKAQQRRLAVEEWRKKRMAATSGDDAVAETAEKADADDDSTMETKDAEANRWNLENDDDGDDVAEKPASAPIPGVADAPREAAEEAQDVDPLDAYMAQVSKEIVQIRQDDAKRHAAAEVAMDAVASLKLTSDNATHGIAARADDESDVEEEVDSLDLKDILARAAQKSKRKEVQPVDHSKVQYESFRKDFYTEPPELAAMSKIEVDLLRTSLDGIKIRGVRCPKPIKNWAQCGLPAACYGAIRKLGFQKPFPVQAQALPAIMSGRDVIGIAKTGSGKTLAFLLPLLRHVLDQRSLEAGDGPIALIMTPTRELAVQIYRECKIYTKALNLRVVCAYGGAPIKDNIADMKRGAEIAVCTPGRMIDLLCANSGRVTNLRRVTYLVLDEADRMFDMGFEPQVMRIVGNVRPDRQTLLFSATFPRTMEALARKILTKPVEITIGARSLVSDDITQIVEVVEDEAKFMRLLEILGQVYREEDTENKTLIFVDRQDAADNLLRDLMRRGYYCMSLHGGKDQMDRESTMVDFKAGEAQILIATSVAARGLDVKNLVVVINYDAPNHMEDYVHRVGRTGRAGNKGTAYTFLTSAQDRYAVDIAKALMASSVAVPEPVQKLVDSHLEKAKDGQALTKSSGFGGKGLDRLDRERDFVRKAQKKTYGTVEDEEEDEDATEDILEAIEIKQAKVEQASLSIPPGTTTAAAKISAAVATSIERAKNEALEKAMAAAARINQAQGLPAPSAAPAKMMTLPPPSLVSLPTAPSTIGSKGHYTAEIEINDYPQKARWTVTRRENISAVYEHTGASVTTKGVYVPPNQTIKPGERKLYLLIEADTENSMERARTELKRALAEATVLALEADANRNSLGGGGGRYSVV